MTEILLAPQDQNIRKIIYDALSTNGSLFLQKDEQYQKFNIASWSSKQNNRIHAKLELVIMTTWKNFSLDSGKAQKLPSVYEAADSAEHYCTC